MIYIDSKRCKEETLRKRYGEDAIICDVTSQSQNSQLIRLSPFFPHGGIPVPFSDGVTASCVEAVWQGLKVFENSDIDVSVFQNSSMKGLKRSTRKFGHVLGHRKGIYGSEILDYLTARKEIYLPTYLWMLENKVSPILERLKEVKEIKKIVLLDYTTNSNPFDTTKPLSHAYLIKAYAEGRYPDMADEHSNDNILTNLFSCQD